MCLSIKLADTSSLAVFTIDELMDLRINEINYYTHTNTFDAVVNCHNRNSFVLMFIFISLAVRIQCAFKLKRTSAVETLLSLFTLCNLTLNAVSYGIRCNSMPNYTQTLLPPDRSTNAMSTCCEFWWSLGLSQPTSHWTKNDHDHNGICEHYNRLVYIHRMHTVLIFSFGIVIKLMQLFSSCMSAKNGIDAYFIWKPKIQKKKQNRSVFIVNALLIGALLFK